MKDECVWCVVLNYNSSVDTKKCIEWLKFQNYPDLHIIVIDNDSSDLSDKQNLMDYHKKAAFFELLLSANNGGFSAGNNIGIKYAVEHGADWILVINPDVEIRDKNYVKKVMDEKKKWKDVGLIGTKTILPDGYNQNPLRELSAFEEIVYPITYFREKKYGREFYKTSEVTGYCEKLSGCCFFINKDFILKNNYLDENVFMYCEEPIIARSAMKLDYKLLYINELTVFHQHYEKTKQGSSAERMVKFLGSRKYYIKEYSEYSFMEKTLALMVKNIQIMLWRIKQCS